MTLTTFTTCVSTLRMRHSRVSLRLTHHDEGGFPVARGGVTKRLCLMSPDKKQGLKAELDSLKVTFDDTRTGCLTPGLFAYLCISPFYSHPRTPVVMAMTCLFSVLFPVRILRRGNPRGFLSLLVAVACLEEGEMISNGMVIVPRGRRVGCYTRRPLMPGFTSTGRHAVLGRSVSADPLG